MGGMSEDSEVGEPEPPAQSDPTGRWTRTSHVLGKGAFKVVYKGFDQEEGLEVAWNQIRMNEFVSTKDDRDRLFAEIRVLKQLKHKNIMSFHDSWLEPKGYTLNFITEYFTSGTLRQYRQRHKVLDAEVMKRWAWQILCGLVYLHGHAPPIIHRDLKCDNIFINGSEGVVKIGDMGLATMLRARTAPQSVLGTPEFMAPELYDEEYDDRVDVYSFGMCMLELATLEYPYKECRNAAQIYRKVTMGVRPKALMKVDSRELAEIVSLCLVPREERPRARQLLKHPYFDSIRNEKLALKLGQEALGVQDPSQSIPPELASRSISTDVGLQNGKTPFLDSVREESDDEAEQRSEPRADQATDVTGGVAMAEGVTIASHQANAASPLDNDEGKREFKVRGRLQEDNDKLNLRLRILQPDGNTQTVEFDFDLASDTAMSVASEMVEEMSLSHGDAHKIAHAIKVEIVSLTQQSSLQGSATQSLDSVSDEEGSMGHYDDVPPPEPMLRQESSGTKYESIHSSKQPSRTSLSQEVIQEVPPSDSAQNESANQGRRAVSLEVPPHTPCSDSVTSVHDHFSEASPPDNLTYTPPIVTRPHSTIGFYTGPEPRYSTSAPGSTTSLGSPPARDLAASEPAPGPFSPKGLNAREQLASALPPRANHLRPSESLLRHLGRTDSANHAQEMEALQQAIAEKGNSRSFNLPNEEDRRLPLMKLLESMEGSTDAVPIPLNASATSRTAPLPALSMPANSQDLGEGWRPVTAPASGTAPQLVIPDFRRSAEAISRGTSPASSTSRQMLDSSRDFPSHPNLAALAISGSKSDILVPESQGGLRAKSKADLLEARRQAAQTSLKNMESHCLEGLDTFGVGPSKGKQQVPIRKMMGGASNRTL